MVQMDGKHICENIFTPCINLLILEHILTLETIANLDVSAVSHSKIFRAQ